MKLIIENSYKEDLKPFIQDQIIPNALQLLYLNIDKSQLLKFDNYLSLLYKTPINTYRVLMSGFKNLKINKLGDDYQISINPNINIPGIPAKLYDICALINYGNSEVSPYPIITKVMDKLAESISNLYINYNYN